MFTIVLGLNVSFGVVAFLALFGKYFNIKDTVTIINGCSNGGCGGGSAECGDSQKQ